MGVGVHDRRKGPWAQSSVARPARVAPLATKLEGKGAFVKPGHKHPTSPRHSSLLTERPFSQTPLTAACTPWGPGNNRD